MTQFIELPDATLRRTHTLVQTAIPLYTSMQRYALTNRIRDAARDGTISARRLQRAFARQDMHPDACVKRLGDATLRATRKVLGLRPAIPPHALCSFDPRFDTASARHGMAGPAKSLARRGALDLSGLPTISGHDLYKALSDAFQREQVREARQMLDAASLHAEAVTEDSLAWAIHAITPCVSEYPDPVPDDRTQAADPEAGLVLLSRSGALAATLFRLDLMQPWAMTLSGALARFGSKILYVGSPHELLGGEIWQSMLTEIIQAYVASCAITETGEVILDRELVEQLCMEFGFDQETFDSGLADRVRALVRHFKTVDSRQARFASDQDAIEALHHAAQQSSGVPRTVLHAVAGLLDHFTTRRDALTEGVSIAVEPLQEDCSFPDLHVFASLNDDAQTECIEEMHQHIMECGGEPGIIARSEDMDALTGLAVLQGGCIAALSAVLAEL